MSSNDCVKYSVTNISVSNESSINRLKYILIKIFTDYRRNLSFKENKI